jgi:hypothetical protein
MRLPFTILLIHCYVLAFSQKQPETFGIKFPDRNNMRKYCGEFTTIQRNLPADVRFGVHLEGNVLFFYMPGEQYYNLIFNKSTDGVAIDIMHKNQFKCGSKNQLTASKVARGNLLAPIYKKEMEANKLVTDGIVFVKYGELPDNIKEDEVEFNLIIIQKKYLCHYGVISNLDFAKWDLLEMGLYRDSLSTEQYKQQNKEISKVLRFQVPFEKNTVTFKKEDIKPLYDSLHLTDYNVKEISIRAYSSVEGTTENNLKLQEGRAASIVEALQSYQKPEINSHVVAAENWVEFLKDIEFSGFNTLSALSKEQVKAKLTDKKILADLEPVLKKHRKALIELKLQKKFSDNENNPSILKTFFQQSIEKKDLAEAMYLQQLIFEKIRDKQIPEDFIGKLEIPRQSVYGPLLNNAAVFNSEQRDPFLYENLQNFESLLQIMPGNPRIKYNIALLKLKSWQQNELLTNKADLEKSFAELEKLGIHKSLILRLKINFYIILTEYLMNNSEFAAKDLVLKEVFNIYKNVKLSDADLLNLAKYLSNYSRFDWANSILQKRAYEVDADSELIFYYLKMNIINWDMSKKAQFRTLMLNAIDKDRAGFCQIFYPKSLGGVTFQLLEEEFLKKTYCENCNKK